jgi:TetR/AcrR family transcriptional regulator, transcriptional repressor for nem operon
MTTTSESTATDTRERLIEGAVTLLHTHAYRAVGVKALCEVAGVRKGSFYHFFSSKEDLTLAALDLSWERFRSAVIEPILDQNLDDKARIIAIRDACLDTHGHGAHADHPHGCIFGRLSASITNGEPLLRARLAEIFTEWAGLLGDGDDGWDTLADIIGRLVLAFSMEARKEV